MSRRAQNITKIIQKILQNNTFIIYLLYIYCVLTQNTYNLLLFLYKIIQFLYIFIKNAVIAVRYMNNLHNLLFNNQILRYKNYF